jgi:hypothetical protein
LVFEDATVVADQRVVGSAGLWVVQGDDADFLVEQDRERDAVLGHDGLDPSYGVGFVDRDADDHEAFGALLAV